VYSVDLVCITMGIRFPVFSGPNNSYQIAVEALQPSYKMVMRRDYVRNEMLCTIVAIPNIRNVDDTISFNLVKNQESSIRCT
jgi:hypothetical protein